jgi:hypothetical protein
VAWYAPAVTPKSERTNAFDIGYLFAAKEVEVWPENWQTWALFRQIGGQWRRAGMNGAAYALDYGVLFHRMDRLRLNDREYEDMFEHIKAMERAALDEMNRESE